MLTRYGGSRRTRMARAALRAAHRSGVSRWAPLPRIVVRPDPAGIEQHVAAVVGRPVRLGVLLGPPRANIKPVLQVFGDDGDVIAFAKVALSDVTAPLLATEAAALQRFAKQPVPGLVTPALLELSSWRGHPVLVQRALRSAQAGRQPTELPAAVVAGVAASGSVRRTSLAGSPFWDRVSQPGPLVWHDLDVSAMARLRDALDPGTECLFGAWHGDFGPWNASWGDNGLEVWDWERFDHDVPFGLDAAHWRVQVDVGSEPAVAWASMCADVSEVLEMAQESSDATVVAACYLLEIWRRYRHDAAHIATPALRSRVGWLCRVADRALLTLGAVSR